MRDYTKFFTYPETAKFMVDILDPKPTEFILEPSAGNGSLVKAVKNYCPEAIVCAVELDPRWQQDLSDCADIAVIKDFLLFESIPKFTSCIANPPFGNGIDLKAHFDKMMSVVKQGGKIIAIVPLYFDILGVDDYCCYPLQNWSKNSDGTTTEIKIISFNNKKL